MGGDCCDSRLKKTNGVAALQRVDWKLSIGKVGSTSTVSLAIRHLDNVSEPELAWDELVLPRFADIMW